MSQTIETPATVIERAAAHGVVLTPMFGNRDTCAAWHVRMPFGGLGLLSWDSDRGYAVKAKWGARWRRYGRRAKRLTTVIPELLSLVAP